MSTYSYFIALVIWFSQGAYGNCLVSNSNGSPASPKYDPHFLILSSVSACPQNVMEYKSLLLKTGLRVNPSLVANRGRNNPSMGSFSFFEEVTGSLKGNSNSALAVNAGEFFFGHFTAKQNNEIVLDQAQRKGQLLIELIAWDSAKKLFNFYELIGNGQGAQWFYRGDSQDILKDNQLLYRTSQPQFGKTLRCSACHSSGGPIMKELSFPHNDWWTTKRPLSFGAAKVSSPINEWLKNLQSAEVFSHSVQLGIQKLQTSPSYQQIKSQQSLQEQLRPLFCDTEINLISSPSASSDSVAAFALPSAAFLNPLFGSSMLNFSKANYSAFVSKFGLHFPETSFNDADHIWLSPVKAYADLLAIEILLKKGLVDLKFVYDVLSVDSKISLFSPERCQLLKLVPAGASGDWKRIFSFQLQSSTWPSAKTLLSFMNDSKRNPLFYQQAAKEYLMNLQKQGISQDLFLKLLKDRQAVFNSEISKNSLGQILEPGFRVIFPQPH